MPRRSPRFTHSAADLRQVAWCQRFLILCMLGQIVVWVGYIAWFVLMGNAPAGPGRGEPAIDPMNVVLVATGLLSLIAAVFVILLSTKTTGTAMGIFLGLLTLVPCLSLLIIVIANTQATSVLQRHGIRVGLIGARMGDIANMPDTVDEWDDDDDSANRPRRKRRRGYADIDEDEGW